MNAIAQTQDVVTVVTEQQVEYKFVEDTDLLHVGGGSATVYF